MENWFNLYGMTIIIKAELSEDSQVSQPGVKNRRAFSFQYPPRPVRANQAQSASYQPSNGEEESFQVIETHFSTSEVPHSVVSANAMSSDSNQFSFIDRINRYVSGERGSSVLEVSASEVETKSDRYEDPVASGSISIEFFVTTGSGEGRTATFGPREGIRHGRNSPKEKPGVHKR